MGPIVSRVTAGGLSLLSLTVYALRADMAEEDQPKVAPSVAKLRQATQPEKATVLDEFQVESDQPCSVSDDDPTWIEPTAYVPAGGRTSVHLSVQFGENTIGKNRVRHRSYNGNVVGPVIRARPGQPLVVQLENNLPIDTTDVDPPMAKITETQAVQYPHGFNVTNLHTHGLHVSPKDPSDNVFERLDPLGKLSKKFVFNIPADHPAGTFWYHAHKHGSVALQLASGMAGALIVEGGVDNSPMLAGVSEKVMVFQQLPIRPLPGGIAQVFAQDIYSSLGGLPRPKPPLTTTINGQLTPVLTLRPGEVQRWRLIHAGLLTSINVRLEGHELIEMALDGIPLKTLRRLYNQPSKLYPGYRADVLVQASDRPGVYCLYYDADNAAEAFRNRTVPVQVLAKVVVEGDPATQSLPDPKVWTTWVTKLYAAMPALKDITDADLKAGGSRKRTITFKHDGPRVFYADNMTFHEGRIDQHIPLNAVEEWSIVAEKDGHPFHIHVNPFQVQVSYPDGTNPWVWRDTLFVAEKQTATVRMRFVDYDGKTVLHCHNLDHEDQGMMEAIQIEPAPAKTGKTTRLGLDKLPALAPAWALDGADGGRLRSAELLGRPLLLVLHRGLDCLHCAEQLQQLAATEATLRDLGVTIVAVSPRYPAADALRDSRKTLGIRFPLLCDPTLRVFRDFGCIGSEPLHGVYLIDGRGLIRWQEVGDSPETDMSRILREVRQLSPPPAGMPKKP